MSNMASETPAPGTGETPPVVDQPSAETSNTDTSGQQPPDTVPYTRFKEVNDRLGSLKGYEQLSEYGYDPDSLGRLVTFEAAYVRDPLGTLGQLVDGIEGLDDAAKAAIKEHLTPATPPEGEGTGEHKPSESDEPPAWAKPLIEDYGQRLTASEDSARQQTLDSIIAEWDSKDKDAGIETPMETKLAYIAANARNGTTVEQIAEAARGDFMKLRENILGDAVQGVGNRTGLPLTVPGGGVTPSVGVAPKTLEEATAMARAAIESGKLPLVRAE